MAAADERSPAPLASRRVLVVDDNHDAAMSLAAVLQERGHQVHTAFDGEQAIQVALECVPEIIFMDLGMPRMDGITATRHIRARLERRRPAVVAVTGWGQDADRQRTRAAGFDEHLVKPVSVDSLERVLREFEERMSRTA
jgi:CheY-like chemotaxis protein